MSLQESVEKIQAFVRDLPAALIEMQAAQTKHLQLLRSLPDSTKRDDLLNSYAEEIECSKKVVSVIRKLGEE